MSGIVALFDREGAGLDSAVFAAMHDRLDHRGADGSDQWTDDRIAIGHQHLDITPQAAYDDQPCVTDELVVAGDVRIDNRPELFDALPALNDSARTPDSQVVTAAYREWGTDCVDHLVGAYAFVVWDRTERTLFCARDPLGVRPLYYYQSPGLVAVASEKKALLALPSVPQTVDDRRVGSFLVDSYENRSRSFFEAIRRLPPAHTMTVEEGSVDRRRYWDLDPNRTVSLASDAAYERRFRALFERAVSSRLRADEPVGADLSGGIDSSSITVMARDCLEDSQPLHTFSHLFDDAPSSDEREFIEAVTDIDGIEPHYLHHGDAGIFGDEDRLRTVFDQPPHNTMHFAECARARRAREEGVGVVLSGALGDSTIGYGLGLLPELLWTGRWRHLYGELQAMGEVLDASPNYLFVQYVLSELVPPRLSRWRRRFDGDPIGPMAANPTLSPSFVDRIALADRYTDPDARGATFTPRSRRRQRRSIITGKNAVNFEALDLTFAGTGVTPRYPFADTRLIEFSLAIPPTQQLRDGWTRSIGRRALSDLLPEEVQRRPWKTFQSEAFWNALARSDDCLDSLAADLGSVGRYLDADAVGAAYERFRETPSPRDARALWRALSLSVWLETTGRNRP
ncbi:asparagine synthetase B [Halapricum sp. CBA1109]|uniref:asparagine synthase-related protein n=1 Tax=Halapricum sp. CBA1109 TaxID=2668068 RepID=UPI0012FCB90E|nr:asparagine synthase-related protein [Halapricum sp. CBA1109]MUV88608.1 asparagine synthetase B [Halapricum sp. CBA1109]